MNPKYEEIVKRLREIAHLRHVEGLLGWDQQTYMPPKANPGRAQQMALLSSLAHERLCDPVLGNLLEELLDASSLNEEQKALVREAKRDRDKAVKIPSDLVREITETSGKAHMVWVEARQANNFSQFAPMLSRLVELKKQEAQALGYPSDGVPYDALLDGFEPGATVRN